MTVRVHWDNPPPPDARSPRRYLWWLARQQWPLVTILLALALTAFAAMSVLPYLLGHAIDDGLDQGVTTELLRWVSLMALASIVLVISQAVINRYDTYSWLRASFTTTTLLGNHVVSAGSAIATAFPTGEIVSTVSNDADRIGSIFAHLPRFVGAVFAYVVVSIIIFRSSALLGLVIAGGLPLVLWLLSMIVKPLQQRQALHREALGALASIGSDTVSGLRVAQGIGAQHALVQRYHAQSRVVRDQGLSVARTQSHLDALQVLLPGLFVTLIAFLAAHATLRAELTPGQLVSAVAYCAFLAWPLQIATQSIHAYSRAKVAASRIIAVLNVAAAVTPPVSAKPLPTQAPLIDVTSGLTVHPGRMVALVSDHPSEARALALRLGRFDDATESEAPVIWGDNPLSAYDPGELRRRIVVSDTTAQVFAGTLREELDLLGTASPSAVDHALAMASALDIVAAVPGGLDGELPERGTTLSGGQRQRIALARVILLDPEILIVIEPTSAVDAHTEARIAGGLRQSRTGRTTVIVTVSPLVLAQVDTVHLLRDGVVTLSGSHHDLMRSTTEAAAQYQQVVGRAIGETSPQEKA